MRFWKKHSKLLSLFLALSIFMTLGATFAKYITTLNVGNFDLNIVQNKKIFAVFDSNDGSLKFYNRAPFALSDAQTIYEGFDTTANTHSWTTDQGNNILTVSVEDAGISPVSTESWFNGLSGLQSADLSKLDTSNVTTMDYMFNGCSSLSTVLVSESWTTDGVASANQIFAGCTSLKGGAGTSVTSDGIDYARIDGGSEHPGYFTYYKYALAFEANGGSGAPDVLLSDDGFFTIPTDSSAESSEGYPLLGWAVTKNDADAEYKSGTTYTINNTAPCCEVLYAVYDKPLVVTNTTELAAVMASGKDLIIEGGTYTYMEGFANGINITLNNVICKNYFVASSNSNIVINGLNGTQSGTSPLLDIGLGSTVTINDAITGNNGGFASIGRNATLIINGGIYARPNFVMSGQATSTLEINGGTFTNVKELKYLVGNVGNVTITGGTFGFDLSASGYVPEGYTVVENSNGTWTVVSGTAAASHEDEAAPICTCETLCGEDAVNGECPVCSTDDADCSPKEPETAAITVNTDGVYKLSFIPDAAPAINQDYTAALTAVEGYALPETITVTIGTERYTVNINGENEEGKPDFEGGKLIVPGSLLTGETTIIIEATGVAFAPVEGESSENAQPPADEDNPSEETQPPAEEDIPDESEQPSAPPVEVITEDAAPPKEPEEEGTPTEPPTEGDPPTEE